MTARSRAARGRALLFVCVVVALGSSLIVGPQPLRALFRSQLGDIRSTVLGVLVGLPAFALMFGIAQSIFPRRAPEQPSLHGELTTDAKYWFLAPFAMLLSRGAGTLGIALLALMLGRHVGPELRYGFGPVTHQPRFLIVIEMLLLMDCLAYLSHRCFHSVPWLWRFHAVHHGGRQLDWLSASRLHPVNDAATYCATTLPLFCLGFPLDAVLPIYPLIGLYAVFIHANLDLTLRPLAYVITSPVFHTFHHTLADEGGHKNFAGLFPIFDKLFGTYYLPAHKPGRLGLDDDDMPLPVHEQLLYPFARTDRQLALPAHDFHRENSYAERA